MHFADSTPFNVCLLLQMVTRTKKIFVGGLSAPTTLEDVKNYFEQFGPVSTQPLYCVCLKSIEAVNSPPQFLGLKYSLPYFRFFTVHYYSQSLLLADLIIQNLEVKIYVV